ncbi:unnamed protein product [Sphagnum jensenii]|uniref:Uncharacterized protein n=1 Tax=Sphagnum jensenii TaxID=128206 RepID=A0ABP1B474_9BRYO
MIFKSMCIDVNQIVVHIEDQGLFARACYKLLEVDAQKTIITEIVTYAMILIIGLNGVKAKHDDTNQNLNLDVPPAQCVSEATPWHICLENVGPIS